jgi:hypothetical protein
VNAVDCVTQLVMTRSASTTEIATLDVTGNLSYYWNPDGSPSWTSGQIGTASWTKSRPPAITRNSDGTETAWEQYGALHYAYNLDGTPTWYVSSVGFHPVVSSDLQLVTPRC